MSIKGISTVTPRNTFITKPLLPDRPARPIDISTILDLD